MILADTGVSTPLKLQLKDGATTKGVRAKIKDFSGALVTTVNCPHVGDGTYIGAYTFAADGNYIAVFTVYTDATYSTVDPTREITSEDYKAQTSSSPTNIANLVWEELLAGHTTPGSTGAAITSILTRNIPAEVWNALALSYNSPDTMGEIMNILKGFNPSGIAGAVWDEPTAPHGIPNTFGDYVQAIRESSEQTNSEVKDGVHGLQAIYAEVNNRADQIIGEIEINEAKIDAIIPAIGATDAHLYGAIGGVSTQVSSLSAQLTAAQAAIIAQIAARDIRFSTLDASVAAIQNNTTVRFIVPERLVKPASGTKLYQFELRLFDETGHAEAPDTTPTIRVRRLDSGVDIVNGELMTLDGAKVGAYFYNFTISAGTDDYQALVEVTVTENGSVRYIPAVTEVTEFEADLTQLQAQITALQLTTTDIDNQVNNGVYGLPALKAGEDAIQASIAGVNVAVSNVKADTTKIPAHPATSEEVADAKTAILARPLLSDIEGSLDHLRDEIRGPGGHTIDDVYNEWDISTVAKTSDPRFNNLDASVSSRGTLTASQVWSYATRTLTDLTLSQANVAAIWSFLLTQATTPGSFGERVAGFLDVPVSTRATQGEVSSLLSGVAQESTVSGLYSLINNVAAANEIKILALLGTSSSIKAKTDLLPSDPASASATATGFTHLDAACANVKLELDQVKAKTDLLPADPARQTTLLQIPTNPVLATDPRFNNLDAKISTRSTLSVSDLSLLATQASLTALHNELAADLATIEESLEQTETKVGWIWDRTSLLPIDPASDTRIAQAEDHIIASLPSGGGSSTGCLFDPQLVAEHVWEHPSRTLTGGFPDTSHLATKDDVAAVGPQYINRMSTSFNEASGDQEMIVWMEKNGSRYPTATNCAVSIYSSAGALQWTGMSSAANVHGIFKFVHPIAAQADANYYVIISTVADGQPRETTQSFVTIG